MLLCGKKISRKTSNAAVARRPPISFQHAQIIENRYTYSCNKICRVDWLNMRSSTQIPEEENSALFGAIAIPVSDARDTLVYIHVNLKLSINLLLLI